MHHPSTHTPPRSCLAFASCNWVLKGRACSIPKHYTPSPLSPPQGFVHISNVSDGRDDAPLDKRYKAGQAVRARVIGFRLVDGLATLSMKKSVLDQQVGGGRV